MMYRVRFWHPDRDVGEVFGRTIDDALATARQKFKRHGDIEVYWLPAPTQETSE